MRQPVDLTNCDREPIHVPGSIQSHGCMLVCDIEIAKVLRHSVNAPAMLGVAAFSVNGQLIDNLFDAKVVHDLRNAANKSSNPRRPGILLARDIAGRAWDIAVHRHNGQTVLEFEPSGHDGKPSALELVRELVARVQEFGEESLLVSRLPRLIRALFGYDRVMIYRFADDGSGKVMSEARRADLESFLGQHFPASDIPRQARILYLKNTIRLIGDVNAETAAIDPELDASGEPLDMSFAHLRSVSPIHIEYLRNMGVTASMSVSLIVDGELWGLVACHHYAPRRLALEERMAAEMLGEVVSLKLQALTLHSALNSSVHARRILDGLMRDLSAHEDVFSFIRDHLADFMQLVPADGIGLFMNGIWAGHGIVPPKPLVPRIAAAMATRDAESPVRTSHELSAILPEALPHADVAAGVLAIPLSHTPRDYLFFFRREQVQTIDWGGDPNKSYSTGPLGDRLTPRKSFAIWKETVQKQSQPWTSGERQIAEAARIQLLEVILRHSEILAGERRKAEERQKILNEELNHRVKNILSLIKSIVSQPAGAAGSVADFAAALNGRIMALSFAHDQVTRVDGGGGLEELISAELRPYRGAAGEIALDGPPLVLEARAFSVLALVLHELTTNAAKYGALSRPTGRLAVTWRLSEDGDCRLDWIERGGPPVTPPSRSGFGSVLLSRSIPFDLNGRSEISYGPGGVEASLLVPAQFVRPRPSATTRPVSRPSAPSVPAVEAVLQGKSVLLVEDQLVIALDAEAMIEAAGALRVHTAATATDALAIIAANPIDVAVLDINLGATTSTPVADELSMRKIPFVFATGYGDTMMVPPSLSHVGMVRKPISTVTLLEALRSAIEMTRGQSRSVTDRPSDLDQSN